MEAHSNHGPALLSPDFLRRLEQLELVSRKVFLGRTKGERLSKRKGQSVELADFRNYVVGDDLRFLDWNLFARLDRLFLRIFQEEEDLHFSLLIDNSLSMSFGEPSKLRYACQVAAALGFIALAHQDRVSIEILQPGEARGLPPLRGRRNLWRMLSFLEAVEPRGRADLQSSLKRFTLKQRGKGVVVVLSDFLDKNGYEDALRYLVAGRYDVYVLQILSPEEIDPEVSGDLKMVDIEDGEVAEITVSPALMHRYRETLAGFREGLRQFCVKRGMVPLFTSTEVPFEKLVLSHFRQRGLVR